MASNSSVCIGRPLAARCLSVLAASRWLQRSVQGGEQSERKALDGSAALTVKRRGCGSVRLWLMGPRLSRSNDPVSLKPAGRVRSAGALRSGWPLVGAAVSPGRAKRSAAEALDGSAARRRNGVAEMAGRLRLAVGSLRPKAKRGCSAARSAIGAASQRQNPQCLSIGHKRRWNGGKKIPPCKSLKGTKTP